MKRSLRQAMHFDKLPAAINRFARTAQIEVPAPLGGGRLSLVWGAPSFGIARRLVRRFATLMPVRDEVSGL